MIVCVRSFDCSALVTRIASVFGLEKVSDLISDNGESWKSDILGHLFTQPDIDRILTIPLSSLSRRDKLIWHLDEKGCYTVKSGYHLAIRLFDTVHMDLSAHRHLRKTIWNYDVPPKVRVFTWRAIRDILPHRVNLQSRHVQVQKSNCVICQTGQEDLLHIFRECPYAREVWMASDILVDDTTRQMNTFVAWFSHYEKKLGTENWKKFLCILYFIWWKWNKVNTGEQQMQSDTLYMEACSILHQHLQARHDTNGTAQPQVQSHWEPPPPGIWKVNIDASKTNNLISIEVIIRNTQGGCIGWKAKHVQMPWSVKHADAEAALTGIRFAHHMGGTRIIIEGDNTNICTKIRGNPTQFANDHLFSILKEFETYKGAFQYCEVRSIRRAANQTADFIASLRINAESWGPDVFPGLYDVMYQDILVN